MAQFIPAAGPSNPEFASLQDGLAIVADGNTHAAITSGQYVYVKNHSTLADGLYKATANVAVNGTLSSSNLTADGSGGLNALSEHIATQTIETSTTKIIRKTGNIVTLILKDFEVSAVTITGFIPSGCRPQATVYSFIESIDDSNHTYLGRIEIAASGACSFFAATTYGGSLISAANTKVSGTIAWAV